MTSIFVLTTYEYSTYSYSGLEPNDHIHFASRAGAEAYAEDHKLTVTHNPTESHHASIDEEKLHP